MGFTSFTLFRPDAGVVIRFASLSKVRQAGGYLTPLSAHQILRRAVSSMRQASVEFYLPSRRGN